MSESEVSADGIIVSLLIELFVGVIGHLASKYESKEKLKIEEIQKKLKEVNINQKLISGSLRDITVDSKEVDELKLLINEDIISKKLSNIITNIDPENETIQLLVSAIRERCNYSESKAITLEPIIKEFANNLYGKILISPTLSPYLIIQAIQESRKESREDLAEIKESLNSLHRKVDENQNSTHNPSVDKYESTDIPSTPKLEISPSPSRVTNLLHSELEDALAKLNNIFKSQVDEIREIQKKRDYKKAIELYESLLKDAGNKIDKTTLLGAFVDCALCLININDKESANNLICKAEEIDKSDKRVLAMRGMYYYELKEMDNAGEYVDKSLAADKFYHIALILKTAIELEAGLTGKFVLNKYFLDEHENLKKGFNEKNLAVIYRTVGQCYFKDNEFDKAINNFNESIKIDSLDDATITLLGTSYLNKVIGDQSKAINFLQKLSPEKEELVEKAIKCFSDALELAARYNKIKDHVSTHVNRSTCYMLLGDYDKAYNASEVSTSTEDILKSRAAAAFHKGLFNEAEELLSKVLNATALDITNRVVALLNTENTKKALEVVEESLNDQSFTAAELDSIRYLKYQILLSQKNVSDAEKELNKLLSSSLPKWQRETAEGDYHALINDHDKAHEHYQNALGHSEIAIATKIFIADYYFKNKNYETCFKISSAINNKDLKHDTDISKRLLQMQIVSSFHIQKLDQCRDYIEYGKNLGYDDAYIFDISATLYWQSDDIEKARDELLSQLSSKDNSADLYLLSNLAVASMILGDFYKAEEYYSRAETIDDFYDNSDTIINSIMTFIAINNKMKADEIFKKAINKYVDNKDDRIHKFAPVYYLRENNANLLVEYATEFNKRHGDTEWLWKKDLQRDKEELRSIFSDAIRRTNDLKIAYYKYPIPLFALSAQLGKQNYIHLWNFNREYNLPIYLESGNHNEVATEVTNLSKTSSIVIDYSALLILQELGNEYLWSLDNIFKEVLIYRPIFLKILNELIVEEHDNLRQILTYITNSKRVRFIKKELYRDISDDERIVYNLIPEEYAGLYQVSIKNEFLILIGEMRLRGLAMRLGLTVCGIRSYLEYGNKINKISTNSVNKGIVKLAQKDAQFISFNKEVLEFISSNYPLNEFKIIFKKLSDHIFTPSAQIDTFIDVYIGYINRVMSYPHNKEIVKHIIQTTVNNVKKLTSRALGFNALPDMNEFNFLIDINKINQLCLGYIYVLLIVIYTSKSDEQLKLEYIKIIKDEANLAFWYESTIAGISIIKHVYAEAERKASTIGITKK